MRRFLRENALSLAFAALFLGALAFQALAGWKDFNETERMHGGEEVGLDRYVVSSHFGVAVLENWQSEWLQFTLFILLTVWLIQRGSPESKEPGREGTESERAQQLRGWAGPRAPEWARTGGLRTFVYANSLLLAMAAIWIASWFGQSVTGLAEYNDELEEHDLSAVSWLTYLGRPDFWERTLQNWQSEFLAVGTMVVFSIYLRQRGSPESKPVGAPHAATGVEG